MPEEGTAMEKGKLTLSPRLNTEQAESGKLPLLQESLHANKDPYCHIPLSGL